MRNASIITIWASLILVAETWASTSHDITRHARIVVDTTKNAQVAAGENLSDYLQKIADRKLKVEDHSTPADSRYTIAVGDNGYTQELTAALKDMDRDGFIIRSATDKLLIRGVNGRSTGYAVNYFLQTYCGVRWYLPLPGELGTVVPRQEEIPLTIFTDKQEPSFVSREFGGGKEWIFRNLGGRRWHVQHNFHWQVMPIETYYEDHPEYYALINGRREVYPGWFQPCMSNPDVVQLCVDYAIKYFKKNPEAYVVPMGLNDGEAYCQCQNCLDVAASMTDRIYIFYDRIARGLQEHHPGKKVGVLVYAGGQELPSPEVRQRVDFGNLAGGLPWDRTDWFMPQARAADQELIGAWSKRLDSFFFWDWFTWDSDGVPTMNIRVIDTLVKYAKSLGNCTGMYNQTARNKTARLMHGPHMWVFAQLMWNADRDVEELLDDFCTGMFGAGGHWMKKYYNRIQEVWWRQSSSEVDLWKNYAAEMALFNEADMGRLRHYLQEADKEANTRQTRARVKLMSDLFYGVELTWQSSRGVREALSLTDIANKNDASRAEQLIGEVLAGLKAIKTYRQKLKDENAPDYLQAYAGFRWQFDVPWLVADLIRYRLENEQPLRLKRHFRQIGERYGDLATGSIARALSEIDNVQSLLDGENLIINPHLQKDGFQANGLTMFDWTQDDLCPAGWYRWHPDRRTHFFSQEDSRTRAGSAYGITGERAYDCYQQIVPAKPGDTFLIRARIKPHLITGSAKAFLNVKYWNKGKKWIPGESRFGIPAGMENDRWYAIIGSVTAPENARYVAIGLWGRGFGDKAQDWVLFDDIRVIKINAWNCKQRKKNGFNRFGGQRSRRGVSLHVVYAQTAGDTQRDPDQHRYLPGGSPGRIWLSGRTHPDYRRDRPRRIAF
jgi:hypothetical protein